MEVSPEHFSRATEEAGDPGASSGGTCGECLPCLPASPERPSCEWSISHPWARSRSFPDSLAAGVQSCDQGSTNQSHQVAAG